MPKKTTKKTSSKKRASKKSTKRKSTKKTSTKKRASKKTTKRKSTKKTSTKKRASKKTTKRKSTKKTSSKKPAAKKKALKKNSKSKTKKSSKKKRIPRKNSSKEVSHEFVPQAHPDSGLSQKQVEKLYTRLLEERDRVTAGLDEHLSDAISNADPLSDEMDVAQRHTEQAYLMRFADKERKLLNQISIALDKLRSGDYGVCEGTGEPISWKRLQLRPWTRYSVEFKEQVERERRQRQR